MNESADHQRFDTLAGYRAALTSLIGNAQHRLYLYEQSLEESDLGSRAMHDLLWQFLAKTPAGTIRILVHDTDYLINRCPRLMQLREHFSHLIEIRTPYEETAKLETGIILVDEDNYLKRIHFNWMRGEFGLNGRESALLEHQFDQLWEHASTPLGIHSLNL